MIQWLAVVIYMSLVNISLVPFVREVQHTCLNTVTFVSTLLQPDPCFHMV